MKKTTNIITLIFAALTLVFAVLNIALTSDPSLVSIVISAVLAVSAFGIWAAPVFFKNKLITIIPVAALFAVSDYMETLLEAIMAQVSTQITLPTGTKFETLGLMLTIAFAVAMVFAFKKGSKWAVTVSIVYSSLMLITQAQLFLTYATAASAVGSSSDLVPLLMIALAFITAFATQVSMFVGLGATENAEAKSAPEAPADPAAEPSETAEA